jgi:hypothetical protein
VKKKLIGMLLVVVILLLPISCKKVGSNSVAVPVKPAETKVEETKATEAKELNNSNSKKKLYNIRGGDL